MSKQEIESSKTTTATSQVSSEEVKDDDAQLRTELQSFEKIFQHEKDLTPEAYLILLRHTAKTLELKDVEVQKDGNTVKVDIDSAPAEDTLEALTEKFADRDYDWKAVKQPKDQTLPEAGYNYAACTFTCFLALAQAKTYKGERLNVLEIGPGFGTMTILLLQINPHVYVDAVDLVQDNLDVIQIRAQARKIPNSDKRLNTIPGDISKVELGKKYDIVIFRNTFHLWADELFNTVLKKIDAHTNSGATMYMEGNSVYHGMPARNGMTKKIASEKEKDNTNTAVCYVSNAKELLSKSSYADIAALAKNLPQGMSFHDGNTMGKKLENFSGNLVHYGTFPRKLRGPYKNLLTNGKEIFQMVAIRT